MVHFLWVLLLTLSTRYGVAYFQFCSFIRCQSKNSAKVDENFQVVVVSQFFYTNTRDRCMAEIPKLFQMQLTRRNWPQMMAGTNSMVVKIGFGEGT
jgi:hypothetical protein